MSSIVVMSKSSGKLSTNTQVSSIKSGLCGINAYNLNAAAQVITIYDSIGAGSATNTLFEIELPIGSTTPSFMVISFMQPIRAVNGLYVVTNSALVTINYL